MAPKIQDLVGIVVGTLKITAATGEKDSSKSRLWEAQCICSKVEFGSRSRLEQYAGHSACPGHPFKGKESPIDGFKLVPELINTPEQKAALSAWETARHGKAPEETKKAGLKPPKERKTVSATGSAMLKSRLCLDGYRLETVKLSSPVTISGHKVTKVVFAKAIAGDDRVLLHAEFDPDAAGKRGIVSSMKKLSSDEWSALIARFDEMQLKWREKEPMKKAA